MRFMKSRNSIRLRRAIVATDRLACGDLQGSVLSLQGSSLKLIRDFVDARLHTGFVDTGFAGNSKPRRLLPPQALPVSAGRSRSHFSGMAAPSAGDLHSLSAVDVDFRTRDIAAGFSAQEQQQIGHLPWLAQSVQWDVVLDNRFCTGRQDASVDFAW